MFPPRSILTTLHQLAGTGAPDRPRHDIYGSSLCFALFAALLLTVVDSPGAEQFLITPTSITSSSEVTDLFSADNLINDSGLNPIPTLTSYQSAEHGSASPSRAWATAAPGGSGSDYFAGRRPDPSLTFTLPDLYQVTHLVLWGFYYTSPNNSEAKSFTLQFSSNGGRTWTGETDVTHRKTAQQSETIQLEQSFQANAIRLTITDNYYARRGVGGERVGLGEVKFIGQPPASPDPAISLSPLVDFGNTAPGNSIPVRTLAIENTGSQPLVINTPASAPPFLISGGPLEIPPRQTRSLEITLPPVTGCHLSTLELSTNDPARPVVQVRLMGAYDCQPETPSQPDISPREGTFVDPFEATIASDDPGVIVYTTDGSIPSADNGTPYTGPVRIDSSTPLRS